jgi:hypothetical protein
MVPPILFPAFVLRQIRGYKNPAVQYPVFLQRPVLFRRLQVVVEGFGKPFRLQVVRNRVMRPSDCSAVYANLRNGKDKYIGVLFDWK